MSAQLSIKRPTPMLRSSQQSVEVGTEPNWPPGYVPSATEWNAWWALKLDASNPDIQGGPFVSLNGGTMTGALILASDPSQPTGAATKQYVDSKIAGGAPVLSVAGRTGNVVLNHVDIADWVTATNAFISTLPLASTTVVGGVKVDGTTIHIDGTGVISSSGTSGVSSFNTRTGPVVLTSGDVTTALTFTPYNATNPTGFQTAAQVTTAIAGTASNTLPIVAGTATAGTLGTFARGDHAHPVDTSRYAASNPSGFQTAAQVTATLNSTSVLLSSVGNANGVAGLDATGHVPAAQLPPSGTLPVASTTVLGGVKIDGTTVTINGSGVISATGAGGGSGYLPLGGGALTGALSITNTVTPQLSLIGSGAGAVLNLAGPAGNLRAEQYYTGTVATANLRWTIGADTGAESGSNNGSSFILAAYTDGGAPLATVLSANRNALAVTMGWQLILPGNPTSALGAAPRQYVVPLAGGTMTGILTLSGNPVGNLDAATKQYVDGKTYPYVALAGSTMTGALVLNADPAVALGAATKQYVDNAISGAGTGVFLLLSGGTLTGALTLNADPTLALHAATKRYVDNKTYPYLLLIGGTLTGDLVLFRDPSLALGAATKQYVDAKVGSINAVLITGSTMTGALTLASDPGAPLQATTKQYTDRLRVGTPTNDNAAAGMIGEFLSASFTAITLTTATVTNIGTLTLTAGDWDVEGNVQFIITGNGTGGLNSWVSQTSTTLPATPAGFASMVIDGTRGSITGSAMPTGALRVSLAASAIIYLETQAYFNAGTVSAGGYLRARRAR
jgi:hypothetical protein